MKLIEAIAQNAGLLNNHPHPALKDAAEARQERIDALLPYGSGFDTGSKIIEANAQRIIIETAYHHMNEAGFYTGWTEHKITVTPSFIGGFDIKVSGRNINDTKDYIAEVFSELLNQEFAWIVPKQA